MLIIQAHLWLQTSGRSEILDLLLPFGLIQSWPVVKFSKVWQIWIFIYTYVFVQYLIKYIKYWDQIQIQILSFCTSQIQIQIHPLTVFKCIQIRIRPQPWHSTMELSTIGSNQDEPPRQEGEFSIEQVSEIHSR